MKRLTLLRHAKTERDSTTGRDIDRQLTERGEADAARIGEEIRKSGMEFDLILSSPAMRAVQTAELAGLSPVFDPRIYNASTDELLAIVRGVDEKAGRVMMIGHNPGFESVATLLTGMVIEMATGSLLEMELAGTWHHAGEGEASVVRFLRPRELN